MSNISFMLISFVHMLDEMSTLFLLNDLEESHDYMFIWSFTLCCVYALMLHNFAEKYLESLLKPHFLQHFLSRSNLFFNQYNFTEEEVTDALAQTLGDKAPSPDGFTFNSYKSCWIIIKADVMIIFKSFRNLCTTNLHLVNTTNITLISKKDGVYKVADYKLMSLIHEVGK